MAAAMGAGGAPPVGATYEDTFDDAAVTLLTSRLSLVTTHTPFTWSLDSSSAGGDTWSANGAGLSARDGGAGNLMYIAPDLGSADHWLEIDVAAINTAQGTGVFVRGSAGVGLTYAGCELGGTGGAGLRLERYTGTTSSARMIELQGYAGETIRVEAQGTTFRVWTEWGKADTASNFDEVVDATPALQGGTYAGIYGHAAAGANAWITAFRAGAL